MIRYRLGWYPFCRQRTAAYRSLL